MIYLGLFLFISLILAFWLINFFGLPGNWLIVVAALVWMWLGPAEYGFGWWLPAVLTVLGLVGEGIEFGASVLGTKRLGGSNRGATCAVIGSIAGAVAGAVLGIPIPIPVIGILVGSVLFAGLGAWGGAILGEHWEGKPWSEAWKIGGAAFVGRVLGTAGKIVIGSAMAILTIVALFWGPAAIPG